MQDEKYRKKNNTKNKYTMSNDNLVIYTRLGTSTESMCRATRSLRYVPIGRGEVTRQQDR
jgi:hypothetical protein